MRLFWYLFLCQLSYPLARRVHNGILIAPSPRQQNKRKKENGAFDQFPFMRHRCQSHVAYDASSLSPCRHLSIADRKPERPPTNKRTRVTHARHINATSCCLKSRLSRTLLSKGFDSVSFIPCRFPLHSRVDRATYSLPSQVDFRKNDEGAVRWMLMSGFLNLFAS